MGRYFFYYIIILCLNFCSLQLVFCILQVELATPGFVDPATGSASLCFTGPAFEIAVEECNRQYAGILNFTVTFLYQTNDNATSVIDGSTGVLSEWYYKKRIFKDGLPIIVSPGALDFSQVHQLAAYWDILYFQTVLYTRSQYTLPAAPILATQSTSLPAIGRTYINFLHRNNWSTIFAVVDTKNSPPFCWFMYTELVRAAGVKPGGFTVYPRKISALDYEGVRSYGSLLDEFRGYSRVMMIFARPIYVRTLLIHAAARNMTGGEYVYICFGNHWSVPWSRFGNITWNYGDAYDEIVKDAIRSLIIVQEYKMNSTVDIEPLMTEVRRRGLSRFGIEYQRSDQGMNDVFACFTTITMIAEVLNESISSGGTDLFNASKLVHRFLRRPFKDQYSELQLDAKGEKASPQAVAHFTGDDAHREIFLVEVGRDFDDFKVILNISDTWPGGQWPPPNEPLCGFQNNKDICRKSNNHSTVIIAVLSGLAGGCLLLALITWYMFRLRDFDGWWRLGGYDIRYFNYQLRQTKSALAVLNRQSVAHNIYKEDAALDGFSFYSKRL